MVGVGAERELAFEQGFAREAEGAVIRIGLVSSMFQASIEYVFVPVSVNGAIRRNVAQV